MDPIVQNPTAVLTVIGVLWTALTASVKVIVSSHAKRQDEKFATLALVTTDHGTKLEKIKDGISEMKLDNERARAELSERLSRTESKLPNGELTKVLGALAVAVEHTARPTVLRSHRRKS